MTDPHANQDAVERNLGDVDVRLVVGTALGLVITAALLFALVWLQLRKLKAATARERDVAARRDPMAAAEGRRSVDARIDGIAGPQLEGLEPVDSPNPLIHNGPTVPRHSPRYRPETWPRGNERQLREPGWVDRDKGIVRIPIDDAMRLMLEGKKFKSRAGGKP
jgi:hypothetical protein